MPVAWSLSRLFSDSPLPPISTHVTGFIWETISSGCKSLLVFVEPSKTVYGKCLVNSGICAPGRSHNHTVTLLERFSGVIHTDGYDAHRTLARKRYGIVLADC